MRIDGLYRLVAKIKALPDKAEDAAKKRVEKTANRVLARSNQLVPVRTGHLRASGEVRINGTEAIIEYTADYALAVHERTDVYHPNGQAKFLQTALNELGQSLIAEFDQQFLDELT